jgi:GNAT superfamily N-acetyltransferase
MGAISAGLLAQKRPTRGDPGHDLAIWMASAALDRYGCAMTIEYGWRGEVTSAEVNALHAEAFETRVFSDAEWDWAALLERHSLGWVTARDVDGRLVGFVNVPWDGLVHAWIQDTMVAADAGRQGIATRLVAVATDAARAAGCEWLHVDFEDRLRPLYFDACGFVPTNAGLIQL